jgi:hypothetical protein
MAKVHHTASDSAKGVGMSGDDEKGKGAKKGFEGLSNLVSDVESEILDASERPAENTSQPQGSPSVDAESPGITKSREAPPLLKPALPVSIDSSASAWKWILGIALVVGMIWFASEKPANKHVSAPTPARAPTPTSTPPRAAAPTQSADPAPLSALQPASRASEEMPPVGTNKTLNSAQIRYCLSEKIRIGAAKTVVDVYEDASVDSFNSMVADYNSRCSQFNYKRGTLESIRSEVESDKTRLEAEGFARFRRNEGTKPLPAMTTRSETDKGKFLFENDKVKAVIIGYYNAVANKQVDEAINMYASERQKLVNRKILNSIAIDTVYYRIDRMQLDSITNNTADVLVYIYHKKQSYPEEYWEIKISLIKESNDWKIWATPGQKIR